MKIESRKTRNRLGGLALAALVGATAACGGNGGGDGGPLSGRWVGPIQSDEGGPGQVTVNFNQSDDRLTGTWEARFDDPAFDNQGTLNGRVEGDTIDVLLNSSNPDLCDFDALGVRDGEDRITGTYETTPDCATSTGGSFDVTRT